MDNTIPWTEKNSSWYYLGIGYPFVGEFPNRHVVEAIFDGLAPVKGESRFPFGGKSVASIWEASVAAADLLVQRGLVRL